MSGSQIVPPQGLAGLAAAVGVPWGGRSGSTDSAAAARRFATAQSAEREGAAPALAAGGTWVQAAYMSGTLPPPLPPPPPSMQAALQANPILAARFGLLMGNAQHAAGTDAANAGHHHQNAGPTSLMRDANPYLAPQHNVPHLAPQPPLAAAAAVGASQLEVEAMQRVVAAARQREGALGATAGASASARVPVGLARRTATPTTGRAAVRSAVVAESGSERRVRLERRQALLNSHRDSGGVAREARMREQRIQQQHQSRSGTATPRTSSTGPSSRRGSFNLGPSGSGFAAPTASSRAAAAAAVGDNATAHVTRRALKGIAPDVAAALRDGVPYRVAPAYADSGATYPTHSGASGIAGDPAFISHYSTATGADATLATAQVAVRVPRLGPNGPNGLNTTTGIEGVFAQQHRDPHGHSAKSLYTHVPVASAIGAAAEGAYTDGVSDMLRRLKDQYVGLRVHPEAALAYAPSFDSHTGRLAPADRTRTSPLRTEMRPGGAAAIGQPSPLQAIAGRGATFATAPMPPVHHAYASATAPASAPMPPLPPVPLPTLPRRGASEAGTRGTDGGGGAAGGTQQTSARAAELRAELEALERQWRETHGGVGVAPPTASAVAAPMDPRETPARSQSPEPRVGRGAVPIPIVHVDLTPPALPPPPAPLSTRDAILQRLNAGLPAAQ